MSDLVPAEDIEEIVGQQRHNRVHYGRAVTAEQTLYVMHSHECLDSGIDLRDCEYSTALDRGIDTAQWRGFEDEAVALYIDHLGPGRLRPLGKPRPYQLKRKDRVRFRGEKPYAWTVQVAGERYVILTKQAPFKTAGELRYTICDSQEGRRGPSNLIGNGWDMQSHGPLIGARALHVALLAGDVEISHRSHYMFTMDDIEAKP